MIGTAIFANETELQAWSSLHRRVTAGERLTQEEQAQYHQILDRLDAEESQMFVDSMRHTRTEIADLEAENRRLREEFDTLSTQVTLLEKGLSERIKQTVPVEAN